MPDQVAREAMPRVILLARAGKAADNLANALRQAGADLVMTADPAQTDEAALRAHDPQVVLVALEPSIENALDKLDTLLVDPALTVIYDEADLAAHRAGWDAARWVRHLSAKLRHDTNVLPPGTESDQDWQPSPGQIPKPAAAYADVDLAVFTREAAASAGSVPSDGMQADSMPPDSVQPDSMSLPAESMPALKDLLSLDAGFLDVIPAAQTVRPPPLPPLPQQPHGSGIESLELESFDTATSNPASIESPLLEPMSLDPLRSERTVFEDVAPGRPDIAGNDADSISLESMPLESMPLESVPLESVPLESVQLESVQLESMPLESMELESMELESMSLGSMPLDRLPHEDMQFEATQFETVQFETMRFENAAPDRASSRPDANSVAPMNLDDDAFFLEEMSIGDASPTDSGDEAGMTFEGRFDTAEDFGADAVADLRSVPPASVAARAVEEVMSFEDLIANSVSAAEAVPAPTVAAPPSDPMPMRSLGDLSLAPVDESPAVVQVPAALPRTHDLSALEARISGLSLVDLDDGASEKPGMSRPDGDVTGVVLVEAGLGGPDPARQLLSSIPAEFPAVVLVRLHLQGGRYDRLVAQMERAAALPVALAQSGGGANPGTIYFLPDGIGLAARRGGLEFTADGAPAEAIFDALPPGDSAVVFLSGSDPHLVDTAMTASARGTLVITQSAEDCYDGVACAELRNRGAASGLPAELAGRLASRWPS